MARAFERDEVGRRGRELRGMVEQPRGGGDRGEPPCAENYGCEWWKPHRVLRELRESHAAKPDFHCCGEISRRCVASRGADGGLMGRRQSVTRRACAQEKWQAMRSRRLAASLSSGRPMSFSCPHFCPDEEQCLRLKTDCVPVGRVARSATRPCLPRRWRSASGCAKRKNGSAPRSRPSRRIGRGDRWGRDAVTPTAEFGGFRGCVPRT